MLPSDKISRARRDLMVRRIFDEAVGLDEVRRDVFIRESCGADGEVEASVRALLAEVGSEIEEIRASQFEHPRIGEVLDSGEGGWRLLEVIGEGGGSLVFRAEWTGPFEPRHDREVAIKILETGRGRARAMERFRTEMETLGRLDHPGIVRAFDSNLHVDGSSLDPAWIAMELVSDSRWITDLTITSESTGLDRVIALILETCDAVAEAHTRGIVHRDLKPSNILVGSDGRVRVIDFGIARLQPDLHRSNMHRTHEGAMIGTPAYMAPEQVDASLGPVTPRTDVYAIGLVAYRLIAGRAPYEIGENLLVAAQTIRHVPPLDLRDIVPSMPESIIEVIDRALEKHPDRRPTDASALAADIRTATADVGAIRVVQGRGRSKVVLPLAVAILFMSVLIGTLLRTDRNVADLAGSMLISVPDDTPSIQTAIGMVGDGGRIMVGPGTYEENLVIDGGSAFTLESTDGPEATVIRPARDGSSVLWVQQGVDSRTRIKGLTFSGGSTGSRAPAGFWVGGGVYLQNNAVHLLDCVFDGNRSTFGGNLYSMNFHGRIERCRFVRGNADAEGGNAFFFRGEAEVVDCDFLDGQTPGNGGGVKTVSGCNRFHGCRLLGNRGDRGGGFMHFIVDGEDSQLQIEDSLIAGNHAFEGGGIWSRSMIDSLILTGTVIRSNSPDEISGPLSRVVVDHLEECWRDLDADGAVDRSDIEMLLEHFDAEGGGDVRGGEFDLDADGRTDHNDLVFIIDGWGRCEL